MYTVGHTISCIGHTISCIGHTISGKNNCLTYSRAKNLSKNKLLDEKVVVPFANTKLRKS